MKGVCVCVCVCNFLMGYPQQTVILIVENTGNINKINKENEKIHNSKP